MFDAKRIRIAAALRIDLPNHVISICDGGWFDFEGTRYRADDPIFGGVFSVQNQASGSNDKAPGGTIVFVPKSASVAANLSNPGMQRSPLRFWQIELDAETGLVIGSKLRFAGMLSHTILRGSSGTRLLEMGYIGEGEWLFSQNEGNRLSNQWHQSWWPGELGMSNITGITRAVHWGVDAPRQNTTTTTSGAVSRFLN